MDTEYCQRVLLGKITTPARHRVVPKVKPDGEIWLFFLGPLGTVASGVLTMDGGVRAFDPQLMQLPTLGALQNHFLRAGRRLVSDFRQPKLWRGISPLSRAHLSR